VDMAQLESLNNNQEDSIRKEIRDWSRVTLEAPIKELNGLSGCPYAKKAWADNKVDIAFKRSKSFDVVYQILESFDDEYDLTIVVDLDYEEDPYMFHQRVEAINYSIAHGAYNDLNLWVMSSHPEDEGNEENSDDEFVQHNDCDYAMMYIQRLDHLQESANKLKKTDYYSYTFGSGEPSHVFRLREKFYQDLQEVQNGWNEKEGRYEEAS